MNRPASAPRAVALLAVSAALSSAACLWIRDTDALKKDYGTSALGDGGALADGALVGADGSTIDAAPLGDGGCRGTAGPTMIEIPGAGYCVDSTEVTYAQYQQFFTTNTATPAAQRAECAWNDDYAPQYHPQPDDAPVVFVDWCDAVAYCAWAGKRLCGAIGGGAIAPNELANANRSQWFRACSQDGQRTFAYGPDYVPERCNGDHNNAEGGVEPVKTRADCVGGYPGLFDMSGNAREWEDACDAPGSSNCLQRGGAFYDIPGTLACDNFQQGDPKTRNPGLGFRCCSKP